MYSNLWKINPKTGKCKTTSNLKLYQVEWSRVKHQHSEFSWEAREVGSVSPRDCSGTTEWRRYYKKQVSPFSKWILILTMIMLSWVILCGCGCGGVLYEEGIVYSLCVSSLSKCDTLVCRSPSHLLTDWLSMSQTSLLACDIF